jgi:hypothetical protein
VAADGPGLQVYKSLSKLVLQQCLAQGRADEGAADADGRLHVDLAGERGVDLHEVHRNEEAGLVEGLADVVTFAEGQAASDLGTFSVPR